MEREDVELRTVEIGCEGGQGSPSAVAPRKKKKKNFYTVRRSIRTGEFARGDKNGIFESVTVKYGHVSHGTWIRE
jgi:hypothetical protein